MHFEIHMRLTDEASIMGKPMEKSYIIAWNTAAITPKVKSSPPI